MNLDGKCKYTQRRTVPLLCLVLLLDLLTIRKYQKHHFLNMLHCDDIQCVLSVWSQKTFELQAAHLHVTDISQQSGIQVGTATQVLTFTSRHPFGCWSPSDPLWLPRAVSQHDTVPGRQTAGCSSPQHRHNTDLHFSSLFC